MSAHARTRNAATRHYGEASREMILVAAQKLFAARGLGAVSMHDIADEAGVSRATVFNQFGSKQLVLDAITARSLASYRDILAAALADEETPAVGLLRGMFAQMSIGLERNRALYREVFAEIRKTSMGLDATGLSPGLKREAHDLLTAIFARGQARGELSRKHEAGLLAAAYDSMLSGAVTHWLHSGETAPVGPLLAAMADVFLSGVRPR